MMIALFLKIFILSFSVFAEQKPFFWGVSTSSYQIEESAPSEFQTDWDVAQNLRPEKLNGPKGEGTWGYSKTARDIRAMKKMHFNAYRFSIEWARVESSPGTYNQAAINHYVQLAKDLKSNGIEPIVCLWHTTFPDWASHFDDLKNHAWLNSKLKDRWPAYVRTMVEALKPYVTHWAPQNEPNAQAFNAYGAGNFPPFGFMKLDILFDQINSAAQRFIEAQKIIKNIQPSSKIMTVQAMTYLEPAFLGKDNPVFKLMNRLNYSHLSTVAPYADWIGFNYYYRTKATIMGAVQSDFMHPDDYMIYPEGLYRILKELFQKYSKPVIVTENGVSDPTDSLRLKYIPDHVRAVLKAKKEGIPVRGYLAWTLVDNFEWASGYGPKFGISQLDPNTKEIIFKPSADAYQKLIDESSL